MPASGAVTGVAADRGLVALLFSGAGCAVGRDGAVQAVRGVSGVPGGVRRGGAAVTGSDGSREALYWKRIHQTRAQTEELATEFVANRQESCCLWLLELFGVALDLLAGLIRSAKYHPRRMWRGCPRWTMRARLSRRAARLNAGAAAGRGDARGRGR